MFNYNLFTSGGVNGIGTTSSFYPLNYNNVFVDSIKEAEAAPADFSGNPLFFFNKKENEIYFKQFNMQTGQIYFGKYVFEPIKEEKTEAVNADITEALKRLEDKCDYLYEMVKEKSTSFQPLTPNPSPTRGEGRNDAIHEDETKKGKVDKDDE